MKIQTKLASIPVNEQTVFGENTAASIVVISATSREVGTILHSNEEIYYLLGHSPKDLLGKKVDILMPAQLGAAHDSFIHNYFETTRSKVINKKTLNFAASKSGYLKHVELLVKVYPQLTDKIVFVGFIQEGHAFENMKPPKQELEKRDCQYIMADSQGNITCVTEGLNIELGLNSKFFGFGNTIF